MKTQLIAKAIVVNDRREVLLLRRSETDKRRPLQWDFPGGSVDDDDASYAAACAREAGEEADIQLSPGELELVRAESEVLDAREGRVNFTWFYYLVRLVTQPEVKLSFEHDKFQWVSLDEAIAVSEYDRQVRVLTYIRDNNLLEV